MKMFISQLFVKLIQIVHTYYDSLRSPKKYIGLGRLSLIIAAIMTTFIVIFSQPQLVQAKSNITVASKASNWSAASFPVENFQAYTSPFGYRRSPTGGNRLEFHNGLDLAAPKGSYIRNWWGGTAVKVGSGGACGTHVIIRSGDWQHSYCHLIGVTGTHNGRAYMLDRAGGIVIWQGQQIPTGARMGRVGMTGRTTGPHLHWTIRHRGRYVDPAVVLRAMFAQQRRASSRVTPEITDLNKVESQYAQNTGY